MIKLIHGDALQEIKNIDKKINCIIADIPQGITRNEWDIPFNLEELWQVIGEIADDDTPVILMSNQPYTKEGDMVLDFCMGSGTTGVACKRLNRKFIGIDKSKEALEIAKNRLGVV